MKLFSLMVALLVAGLAVVGGTWATTVNYTNSETSVNTNINTMEYEVDLKYYNGNAYITAIGQNVFQNSVWCPGRTEIVYLQIENKEKFPIDVYLTLDVIDTQKTGMGSVLTAAWLKGDSGKVDYSSKPANWKAFCEAAGIDNVQALTADVPILYGEHKSNVIPAEGVQNIALAIHMEESATSDYANMCLDFGFTMQVNADYRPEDIPPTATPVTDSPENL